MSILGVIPARYASTRFPGKPLVEISGKTMVQRVYLQAKQAATLDRVVVATDDPRIFAHVEAFGGEAVMTSSAHPTGTDRVLEVTALLPGFSAYINIQGDEPYIDPQQIDQVGSMLTRHEGAYIATLAKRLTQLDDLHNPNIIKVVRSLDGRGLYFSRSPIPHIRQAGGEQDWHTQHGFYKHIGIYGYTRPALAAIAQMTQSPLELAESLEQLRWLENGLPIYVDLTTFESHSVDVPDDLLKLAHLG
jgi:3-deoxy-manno-octulosonate cytidylyltransferase (CMP-KDO synthetase)